MAAHFHYYWQEVRQELMAQPGAAEAYEAARRASELGESVVMLRHKRGWSQRKLAKAAGMTESALDDLELGGPVPSVPALKRLASVLEANLEMRLTPRDRSGVR